MKKILFSDIDGTIANDNLPITYKDQGAVKRLRAQGHYFSFCTGRNIQETKLVTPHFEYDYLVLNNGAMIVDQNDQVLYRKQIKNEIAKEILKEIETDNINNSVNIKPAKQAREDNLFATSLLNTADSEVVSELKKLDVNTLTPIEAMNILYKLKGMV